MRIPKQILEERARLIADARKLNDSIPAGTAPTAEQRAQLDKMFADAALLKDEADRASRFEAVDGEERNQPGREDFPPGGSGEDRQPTDDERRHLAIAGWMVEQNGDEPTDEMRAAAKALRVNLRARELTIPMCGSKRFRELQRVARSSQGASYERRMAGEKIERRDMVTNVAGSGGLLTAPEEMVASFERARLQYGGILQLATVHRTPHANPLRLGSLNDTANTGAWIVQGQDIGAGLVSTDPSVAALVLYAHKNHSKPTLVTSEMIRDDVSGAIADLFSMHGERIGRLEATAFATGSGAGQPTGLVTGAASSGITTGSATTWTADELKRLAHTIDPARRSSGCAYLVHDSGLLATALLKNAEGEYLWQPSVVDGSPDRFYNFPMLVCQEIAAPAASAKACLFGQISSYHVRQVGAVRLVRLTELFRLSNDADGFVVFNEVDGGLLNAGDNPVKYLTMAA